MNATVSYQGTIHTFQLQEGDNVAVLRDKLHEKLGLPPVNQKLLYKGVLQDESPVPKDVRILLVGSTPESVAAVVASADRRKRSIAPVVQRVKVNTTLADPKASVYTFSRIDPLHRLPNPDGSLAFLKRLAADPAVIKVMIKHKYRVGLLTELDPRLHITHDGFLKGLNQNAGETILLRLRTDDLSGWRDYKDTRSTLLHELCHNEIGPHDKKFWALFRELSKEVVAHETGAAVGGQEVYMPAYKEYFDAGVGWSGGEFQLGADPSTLADFTPGLSLRDIAGKAAEARKRKDKEQ